MLPLWRVTVWDGAGDAHELDVEAPTNYDAMNHAHLWLAERGRLREGDQPHQLMAEEAVGPPVRACLRWGWRSRWSNPEVEVSRKRRPDSAGYTQSDDVPALLDRAEERIGRKLPPEFRAHLESNYDNLERDGVQLLSPKDVYVLDDEALPRGRYLVFAVEDGDVFAFDTEGGWSVVHGTHDPFDLSEVAPDFATWRAGFLPS